MYRHERTLVVIYPLETGEWLFAEVTGPDVIHFGPFESEDVAKVLLSDMYPETPIVELPAQSTKLDNDSVTILGYAAAQQPMVQEEAGE